MDRFPTLPRKASTYHTPPSVPEPTGKADFVYLPKRLEQLDQRMALVGPPALLSQFKDHLADAYPGLSAAQAAPLNCSHFVQPATDVNGTLTPAVNIFPYVDVPSVPAWGPKTLKEFPSEAELVKYTMQSKYGRDAALPELYAAVVFTDGPPHWSYTVRMNLTATPTTASVSDNLQRGLKLANLQNFLFTSPDTSKADREAGIPPMDVAGFSSIQLAVDKFIVNRTQPKDFLTVQEEAAAFAVTWGCTNHSAIFQNSTIPTATQAFQEHVTHGLLKSSAFAPQGVTVTPFPVSGFKESPFYDAAKNVFALLFLMAFLYPAFVLIRSIVQEKETRIREGMRMMGMGEVELFTAWYITYSVIFAFVAVLVTALTAGNIFSHSNFFLLFVNFWLFGLSSVALCFLIAAFFSRAKLAAVVGTVLFIAGFFPYYTVNDDTKPLGAKIAASLLAPTAFGLNMNVLATLESNDVGATWGTLYELYGNFSLGHGMLMMFLDFFIYTILGYYVDQVFPSEFGVQRPWYFPCTPSFWCGSRGRTSTCNDDSKDGVQLTPLTDTLKEGLLGQDGQKQYPSVAGVPAGVDPSTYEAAGSSLRTLGEQGRCIKVRGLRKEFDAPDGVKTAVDNLTVDMYEGQIFALLGHNGAGKSTTISMLTGLLPLTGGKATINGLDLGSDLREIRQNLGVCPQHDVLWDDLTVKEHLQYFAGIKGVAAKDIPEAVDSIIQEVGLTEKVDYLSSQLSGGQKRKLSVAIALIGGSKIVFLDEPTSGMDPYSRRSTWQILQNARAGRIMVLTTHFMDEADILGDRIGIMSEGGLVCCGTSMFLKRLYGVGYSLTIVKKPGCNVKALQDLIASHVPKVKLLSNVGMEISFQVPMSSSEVFPNLFRELEDPAAGYKVDNYGIGVTTLEEVFLKVAELGAAAGHMHTPADGSTPVPELAAGGAAAPSAAGSVQGGASAVKAGSSKATKVSSALEASSSSSEWVDDYVRGAELDNQDFFWIHFNALILKRMRVALRDRKAMVFQLLIPVLALLAGLILLKVSPPLNPPALVMSARDLNPGLRSSASYSVVYPGSDPSAADGIALRGSASGPTLSIPSNTMGVKSSNEAAMWAADVNLMNGTATLIPGLPEEYPDAGVNASFSIECLLPNPALGASPSGAAALWAPNPANGSDILASVGQLSQWLLSQKSSSASSKYGAFWLPLFEPSKGDGLPGSGGGAAATASLLVNSTLFHGVPLFLNIFTSTLYNATLGDDTAGSITVSSHPFPYTEAQKGILSAATSFVTVLFISIAFAFIPASFAVFIVKEREINAKHQQLISGVSIFAYWASTFVWDILNYLLPCFLSVILIVSFGIKDLVQDGAIGGVIALFVLYGTSVAAFTYVMSYAFKSHSTAQTVVLILNLLCVILLLASFIMQQIPSTCKADRGLRFVYRLIPGYSLGNGLLQLSLMKGLAFIDSNCGELTAQQQYSQKFTPFSLEVAGWPVIYMAAESVLYFLLAWGIDVLLSFPSIRATLLPDKDMPEATFEVDKDVAAERQRVESGQADGEAIVVKGLRKVFGGSKAAVRNMTFSIPKGQVFGFLGINGAGKTSTLKMLSGDIVPTSGSAKLQGRDILTDQIECRRLLGYCPQFDALFELLTVREHLELYARIKGVPSEKMESVVQAKMHEMNISHFENRCAGQLSGGNKRKLSVAISLIGKPPLVFLDEPSTGMDPVARRFMWNVIARVATARQECSIILTTHSMEECEALCQQVGIMVGGRFRCLGSIQHLKNRFGKGYLVEVKLQDATDEGIQAVVDECAEYVSDGRISATRVKDLCEHLGDSSRAAMIHANGSGWAIAAAFASQGSVAVDVFAHWWAFETVGARLNAFMKESFRGCRLVERHGEFFRFQLPELHMPLSEAFGTLEGSKDDLRIATYSMSQTTLEQIFNVFASQQEEEKGTARGMGGSLEAPVTSPSA